MNEDVPQLVKELNAARQELAEANKLRDERDRQAKEAEHLAWLARTASWESHNKVSQLEQRILRAVGAQ